MTPTFVRALAGAALACTLLGPLPATAQVFEFTCTVVMEGSGNSSLHRVRIDTDALTASDNGMTYKQGATSPYASNAKQFVNVGARRITWGSRTKSTGTGAGVFSIDALTGLYTFSSRFRGLLGQGTCHRGNGDI